ncbi:hypothetical protein C770_GR4pC0175 (plasmid) [Sinorhizobium meliloti GR4]|nr:hypothetical protein C770_GR4pC0175 [Sinorhizobium meliloti GR4]
MQQRRKIATHCDDRHRRDHSRNSNRTCARKGSPAYDKCFLMIHYAIFRVQNGNTQPGTLRPMLLPLVDTDLNFRTGA